MAIITHSDSFAPWELTKLLSPRATVRVAAVDASGDVLNLYSTTACTSSDVPAVPWAIYLAGRDRRFRLLGFDLDAGGAGSEQCIADAELLCGLLGEAGIGHVVCVSGPSGGRHVWVAITSGVSSSTVASLAVDLKALLPSLDHGLLMNPVTGCLRPPGAPHRDGGQSEVVAGELDDLVASTVTEAQIDSFAETVRLLAAVGGNSGTQTPAEKGIAPVDVDGHPRLPVTRRELPAFARTALVTPVPVKVDASRALWRVLIGAAWAGWSWPEVTELLPEPGLEHARTIRKQNTRVPRPVTGRASPLEVLAADWRRAVAHVASRPAFVVDGGRVTPAAGVAAQIVEAVRGRADAQPGRWQQGSGPAQRRVLDVLCLLVLQAASSAVEADIRRVAVMAGVGRETARTALLQLSADGWLERVREAEGPKGAVWSIDPKNVVHIGLEDDRSQPNVTPPPAPPSLYRYLVDLLTGLVDSFAHDVFTAQGLGFHAGNVFAQISDDGFVPRSAAEQAACERLLDDLLVLRVPGGFIRQNPAGLDLVAHRLGVAGVLEARAALYSAEREAWAWWCAELDWMRAPRRTDARKRPQPGRDGITPLFAVEQRVWPAYPRRADGRADFRVARELLENSPAPLAA